MEMDGDEVLMLIAGVIGAVMHLGPLLFRWESAPLGRDAQVPRPYILTNLLSVPLIVLPVLLLWSDPAVKRDYRYLGLLCANGYLWLGVWQRMISSIGLSFVMDVVDRNNRAAMIALSGGCVGVTFVYCGANVGEGPSLWNNVFSVVVGTIGLMVLLAVVEACSKIFRTVAEERDLASGIRLAGLLLSLGIICGRAVAGNWESAESTVYDFVEDARWAFVPAITAIVFEFQCRPRPTQPFPDVYKKGLVPAVIYMVLAAGCLWHLGWWEGAP